MWPVAGYAQKAAAMREKLLGAPPGDVEAARRIDGHIAAFKEKKSNDSFKSVLDFASRT